MRKVWLILVIMTDLQNSRDNSSHSALQVSQRSVLSLAYIGDAVYELLVREYVMENKNCQPNLLNKEARKFVTAAAQAESVENIVFTEAEADIFRRARNSRIGTLPKNTSVSVYKTATALEAVFGYLYLSGDITRINELFAIIIANK